jgi:hypothetical protein
MRVLILTRSRACQMKRFFYLNVLQMFYKLIQNSKMCTRLWVRAKIFCCDRNGALSKKWHCYRKN